MAPTSLSAGLREWGWDTVTVKTRTKDSERIVTVGSAVAPAARTAYVMGCPLVMNPAEKTDAVAEPVERIRPLNQVANTPAPFMTART